MRKRLSKLSAEPATALAGTRRASRPFLVGITVLTLFTSVPNTAVAAWPGSMAAIGDSFSAAFNAHPNSASVPDPSGCPNGRGPFGDPAKPPLSLPASFGLDCPSNSWSTGTNPQVNSIYQRIVARNPAMGQAGHVANYATTAVSVSDLSDQAQLAADQHAELVTVNIGINDACNPFGRNEQPTPLDTFSDQFARALRILAAGPAHPRILVATIPNANRTWSLFHDDPNALVRWQFPAPPGVICATLLANPTSTATTDLARRAAFAARITSYNLIEIAVCRKTPRCQTDGGALYAWQFASNDIATVANTGSVSAFPFDVLAVYGLDAIPNSTGDYWHPSLRGQRTIADLEWSAAKLGE